MAPNDTSKQIPTINFSLQDLKPGSSSWVSTCKQVQYALEQYGGFVASYEQISPQLMNNMFGQSKDLFDVPEENKVKNTSVEPYRGYHGPNPVIPICGSMAIENVPSPKETQKFRDLMWPNGKTDFCEITDLFTKLLGDLANTVGKMLFHSYGVPEQEYESLASSNTHLLRFFKYAIPEEKEFEYESEDKKYHHVRFIKNKTAEDKEATISLPGHTDKNFTTILIQHDVGGIEVRTKDGDWISVESAPSQVIFMAGDGLQVWSNDRVKACHHRVRYCGDKTRYSLGIFTHNNGIIQVPKELIDDSHPLLYNQLDSCGFIRFYIIKENQKFESPIKTYCGVKN